MRFGEVSKSAGRSSVRRLDGRTEKFARSRARQNVTVAGARSCLPERWRSTGGSENGRRQPGKPMVVQAGRSYRNNQDDLCSEWEQAPGAMGSKAGSGSRAGASALSGCGTWSQDRRRVASPSRSLPTDRRPTTTPATNSSALHFAKSCRSHYGGWRTRRTQFGWSDR